MIHTIPDDAIDRALRLCGKTQDDMCMIDKSEYLDQELFLEE